MSFAGTWNVIVRYMDFEIAPLSPIVGAEVTGLNLSEDLDEAVVSRLHRAWLDHLVLVFRDQQNLSELDQVRFSELFGPLGRPRRSGIPAARSIREKHPAIMLVSNVRQNGTPVSFPHDGEMWFHTDMCYTELPHKATTLYAMELPSSGGNTKFANMYAAYDRVPDDLKRLLEGRKALHVREYKRTERPTFRDDLNGVAHHAHPVFITHPETSRKALYVNRLMTAAIEGLPERESEDVLNRLFEIGEDREIVYEHVWRYGDLVVWDNRAVTHARTEFPDSDRRMLRRTTVMGEQVPA